MTRSNKNNKNKSAATQSPAKSSSASSSGEQPAVNLNDQPEKYCLPGNKTLQELTVDELHKFISSEIAGAVATALANIETQLSVALRCDSMKPVLQDVVKVVVNEATTVFNDALTAKTSRLESEIVSLRKELDDVDMYQRRLNLVIHGIPEDANEDCEKKALELFHNKLQVHMDRSAIQRAHRLGQKRSQGSRPIIVRFVSYKHRSTVYGKKKLLKGSKITITENLTRHRLALYKQVHASKLFSATWTMDGQIFGLLNGKKTLITSEVDLSEIMRKN